MNVPTPLLAAVLCIPVTVNLWATVKVCRSTQLEQRQRVFQLLLIWLLPLFGATLVFAVLRETEPPKTESFPQEEVVGGDATLSGARRLLDAIDGD
jgi:hypothetical protein